MKAILKTVAVMAVMTFAVVKAEAKVNFQDVKGTYKGKAMVKLGTDTFTGPSTIGIVSSSRRRAYLYFHTDATHSGTTFPFVGALSFLGGNKLRNYAPYLGLTVIPGPTVGKFKAGRRKINFSGMSTQDPNLTFRGIVSVRETRRRRHVAVVYGLFSGGAVIISGKVTGKQRVRRSERRRSRD